MNREYFDNITACGENCSGCPKMKNGSCPGCIKADGYVPAWKESGRCRIHACVKEHNAVFCGVCSRFPCDNATKLIHWKNDPVSELSELADEYRIIKKQIDHR